MDTAFLMFCVCPSTFSPTAFAFFDDRLQLLVGDVLGDLDDIDADRFQAPHVRARLGGVFHEEAVHAPPAGSDDARTGYEEARTFDQSALERLALCEVPCRIVVKVGNRRHAVGQEHRQVPVDQVHVGVDEAGKDRPAVETDDVGVRRRRDLSSASHRGDAIAFDNHHGISDRRSAGAVDQRPALEDEHTVLRRGPRDSDHESDEYPADQRPHSCLTFAK
jgi:hypothetical protein